MNVFFISFLFGCLTAFFGWAGGRGKDYHDKHPNWPMWALSSWMRDWVIGPLCAIEATIFGAGSPWLLLMIPATGGALSTYWDSFPPNKGKDNFWMHGFFVGLAAFPICFTTGEWGMMLLRTLICTMWMGGWSASVGDAHAEEAGRYFIVGSTLPMIL